MTEALSAAPFNEEIDRKTVDSLALIVSSFERGAVSRRQAGFALTTLFTAVSGLVSSEVFDLINQASAEITSGDEVDSIRRFFVKGTERVIVLEYIFEQNYVMIKDGKLSNDRGEFRWEKNQRVSFESEADPYATAKQRFSEYAASLIRNGFKELK